MNFASAFTLSSFPPACAECRLRGLCLPVGMPPDKIDRLDRIVNHRRPLAREEYLYRQRERFRSLFVVRSGSIKSVTCTKDGDSQVNAFHLPGEILGLDAINDRRYTSNALALETTTVCELPFERLNDLAHEFEGLQRQLMRIISRELGSEDRFARMLADLDAEQRLAGFLLNLAHRYRITGHTGDYFKLPMRRSELANYLGLAGETVSRLFKRFQQSELVRIEGTSVRILQKDVLAAMAGKAAPHLFDEAPRTRA